MRRRWYYLQGEPPPPKPHSALGLSLPQGTFHTVVRWRWREQGAECRGIFFEEFSLSCTDGQNSSGLGGTAGLWQSLGRAGWSFGRKWWGRCWRVGRDRQVVDARIPRGQIEEVTWSGCALFADFEGSPFPQLLKVISTLWHFPPHRLGNVTHSMWGGFYQQPWGNRKQDWFHTPFGKVMS